MRSKQYFTSIKNNPHEISTDPKNIVVSHYFLWLRNTNTLPLKRDKSN